MPWPKSSNSWCLAAAETLRREDQTANDIFPRETAAAPIVPAKPIFRRRLPRKWLTLATVLFALGAGMILAHVGGKNKPRANPPFEDSPPVKIEPLEEILWKKLIGGQTQKSPMPGNRDLTSSKCRATTGTCPSCSITIKPERRPSSTSWLL